MCKALKKIAGIGGFGLAGKLLSGKDKPERERGEIIYDGPSYDARMKQDALARSAGPFTRIIGSRPIDPRG